MTKSDLMRKMHRAGLRLDDAALAAQVAVNAMTGHRLSERDGWLFMVALKAARAATPGGRHNADDYVDMRAYAALTGECAERAA